MPESRKVDAMGHGYVTLVSADGFEFVVRPLPRPLNLQGARPTDPPPNPPPKFR